MNKILIYLSIALIIAVSILGYCYKNERAEKTRLKANQEALLSKAEYYRTESGKSAASVQKLELSKSELETYCKDLNKTIGELNIKVKRVQSASTTATSSEYNIQTIVKDTTIYRDKEVTIQNLTYKDPWIDLSGTIENKIFTGQINTRDTLVQVVHRIPKQFLFFKWGTKAIRQEVISKNPHSKIVFTEYIELKK